MDNLDAILSGLPAAPAAPSDPAPAAAPVAPAGQTPTSTPPANAGGNGGAATAPAGAEPAKGGQAAPQVSDDEVLAAAGLTESPEKKAGRLERDYAASSKEAKRLLEVTKSLEGILSDQGIDIAKDENGRPIGLIATRKYSKEAGSLDIKVKDLPDDIQAKFESDPQKVVDYIVSKAKQSMTRAVPTLEKSVLPLSPERHETAVNYLAEMKWETGDTKFPGLAANRKLIEQMINAPTASKALKEFYYQEPELALALLNLQLDHARQYRLGQVQKAAEAIAAKKKAAESQPQPSPLGGGEPTIGGPQGDDMVTQITKARLRY